MRRVVVGLLVLLGSSVALSGTAVAHPLGNFTQNTSANLRVAPERVDVDYVLDLAEIPALQARQRIDGDRDGTVSTAEGDRYRGEQCPALAEGLRVGVAGQPLPLSIQASALHFPPGQAGLSTLRLECTLSAPAPPLAGEQALTFADDNLGGRVGWREVTAIGDGTTLVDSDVPAISPSARLTAYPPELNSSPPVVRAARLVVRPGGPAASPLAGPAALLGVERQVDDATRAFTSLVSVQRLTVGFALFAIALAAGLGALHALAPGHGKTLMAAYVVGQRGSTRQALGLGLTVAVTHTAGVAVLGAVLIATSEATPERFYPWLGLASGLLFAAVGASLLVRARQGGPQDHHHAHRHDHDHDHDHHHDHPHPQAPTWRSLVAPGLAGGAVPSPSALVVLLAGVALGRPWFGGALVVAYGIGMAASLVGAGLLLLRARGRLEARTHHLGWAGRLAETLPTATGGLVLIAGLVVALRAALQI